MMKFIRDLFLLSLIIGACWGYGFVDFVTDVEGLNEPGINPDLQQVDAIVVLTGGSERVTTGLELLESHIGKKLFISGVHKNLTLEGVLGAQDVPEDVRECCIALGYQAGSTVGNAEETKDWMKEQDYHSMRLVTANYHMPRSLLLFHAAMPDVTIIPHPITPDSVKLYEWWQHPGTIQLLAEEYTKFLLSNLRIRVSEL